MRIFGIVLGVLFVSCSLHKEVKKDKFLNSVFLGAENHKRLIFLNDSLFVFAPPDGAIEYVASNVDTLSYGNWKIDDNLIVLNTSKGISSHYLDREVIESFSGSKDSLYFNIENRREGDRAADDIFRPYYQYYVVIENENDGFPESLLFNNQIQLPIGSPIVKFELVIVPNLRFYPYPFDVTYNTVRTIRYKVKNSANNTFTIKILNFDFRYFFYKRYNGEYVKIIDKDVLMWGNEKYIRTKI